MFLELLVKVLGKHFFKPWRDYLIYFQENFVLKEIKRGGFLHPLILTNY